MTGYEKNGNHDNMPLRCDSCLYFYDLCVPRIDIVHPTPPPHNVTGKAFTPICKNFVPYSDNPKNYLNHAYKGYEPYKDWLVEHIHMMRGYEEVTLTEKDPHIGIRGLFVSLMQADYLYRLRLIDWMEQRYYDVLGNITRYNVRKPLDKRWQQHSDYNRYLSFIGKQGAPFWLR